MLLDTAHWLRPAARSGSDDCSLPSVSSRASSSASHPPMAAPGKRSQAWSCFVQLTALVPKSRHSSSRPPAVAKPRSPCRASPAAVASAQVRGTRTSSFRSAPTTISSATRSHRAPRPRLHARSWWPPQKASTVALAADRQTRDRLRPRARARRPRPRAGGIPGLIVTSALGANAGARPTLRLATGLDDHQRSRPRPTRRLLCHGANRARRTWRCGHLSFVDAQVSRQGGLTLAMVANALTGSTADR